METSLFVRSKSEVKMPFFAVIYKGTILRILFNSAYNVKEDISLYINDIRDQENNDGTIECGKIDLDQSMHYTIGKWWSIKNVNI